MKIQLDKLMTYLAYAYLTLPFLIFSVGWLRWYYAIPVTTIVCISFLLALRQHKTFLSLDYQKHLRKISLALFVICLWILLSGIGGYGKQTYDHNYRNAVLRDLIVHEWPVEYKIEGLNQDHPLEGKTCMLVYYMGYWLPSALVGKLFGWSGANFFLFLWTVLGVSLVYYFICRFFRRFSLNLLLLFIFWGTLYIVVELIKFPLWDFMTRDHILWADSMLYASGNTALVYSVFNQTIAAWLIITVMMNEIPKQNFPFLCGLCLFQSPFALIGLLPYFIYTVFKDFNIKTISFLEMSSFFKPYVSFQNIIGLLSILTITLAYFYSNSAAEHFSTVHRDFAIYLLFVFVSFGLFCLLLYNKYRKEPLYYITIVLLLPLPFYQLGYGLDFVARVSIPPFFILMLLVAKYLIEEPKTFLTRALMVCLLVSALNPFRLIARSAIAASVQHLSQTNLGQCFIRMDDHYGKTIGLKLQKAKWKNLMIRDDLGTLSNPKNIWISNFMGVKEKSFFYQYMARDTSE